MKASTRAGVVRTAVAVRCGAALLVALAAVRLAVVAALGAVHARAPELPVESAQPASAPSVVTSARAARIASAAVLSGLPVRMNLVVTLGGRAEVYVDHYLVGKSPYIGDISCRIGSPVTVQIVPVKGAPRVVQRRCVERGTIEISE